jgi:FMN phosphatase YigB (HAD superfamily)
VAPVQRELKAVFFDVGETLVDETRWWDEHARRVGVSPIVLAATLGMTIERGEDHRAVWGHLGHPVPTERDEVGYLASDLYPDARQCLAELRTDGYFVAVAGNQGSSLERDLRSFGLDVDLITSSVGLAVRKPASEFFERLVAATEFVPAQCGYVGDRVDFDVRPAKVAGLMAIHIRRGPWGRLQRGSEEADMHVDSLAELPVALRSLA